MLKSLRERKERSTLVNLKCWVEDETKSGLVFVTKVVQEE